MPANKTKIITIILIFIVFVGFTIYAALAVWSNYSQPAKTSKPQPASTQQPPINTVKTSPIDKANGLQIYTNANYGFQIDYPASLQNPSQTYDNSEVVIGDSGLSVQQLHKSGENFNDSTLSNRSGQCLLAKNSSSLPSFFYFKDIETIGGATAYHYVNYPNVAKRFCFNGSKCFYYDIYRIQNNGNCYEIVYQRNGGPIEIPDNISQIISTFKFTE